MHGGPPRSVADVSAVQHPSADVIQQDPAAAATVTIALATPTAQQLSFTLGTQDIPAGQDPRRGGPEGDGQVDGAGGARHGYAQQYVIDRPQPSRYY